MIWPMETTMEGGEEKMPLFGNRVALFLIVCRAAFFKVSNPKIKVEISKYDQTCRKIHQY